MKKYACKTNSGELVVLVCDHLNDLASVQECVQTFFKAEQRLDILINNDGIMALPRRVPTQQGAARESNGCLSRGTLFVDDETHAHFYQGHSRGVSQ